MQILPKAETLFSASDIEFSVEEKTTGDAHGRRQHYRTTYVFQVRAAGGSTGYSEWSNPVSRIAA